MENVLLIAASQRKKQGDRPADAEILDRAHQADHVTDAQIKRRRGLPRRLARFALFSADQEVC
jgi:hypothetical protein